MRGSDEARKQVRTKSALSKNEIESGRFMTGSRLPSIRRLQVKISTARTLIQRALMELRQWYTLPKPQSGYYVLEQQTSHEDSHIR